MSSQWFSGIHRLLFMVHGRLAYSNFEFHAILENWNEQINVSPPYILLARPEATLISSVVLLPSKTWQQKTS